MSGEKSTQPTSTEADWRKSFVVIYEPYAVGGWWPNDAFWDALRADNWEVSANKKKARVMVDDVREAFQRFEFCTNEKAAEEECECCGSPHNFFWLDRYGTEHHACAEKVRAIQEAKDSASLQRAIDETAVAAADLFEDVS